MRVADPNKTPLRFRKLRIAFSAVCGFVCLLLIMLWVRSYTIRNEINTPLLNQSAVVSMCGEWILVWGEPWAPPTTTWHMSTMPMTDVGQMILELRQIAPNGFAYRTSGKASAIYIPQWLPAAVASAFTALPLLSIRFSLRTLLIATTLVAVAFGVIVLATRK